ncbi:conserved membrane hypothetical protein [Candidatus Terasakiella magnetica]|nr:conserved membrane hypothetical protein [Candidatus Terasakiella magnetica]
MNTAALLTSYKELFATQSAQPGLVAASALVVLGGVVLGSGVLRRADPATSFGVGMGLYVLLLTGLGVLGLDLRWGLAAAALAVIAQVVRNRSQLGLWMPALGLTLLAMAPLLLILSDHRGSEWDEFSHWLHAFRYLAQNHTLPGGLGKPPTESCCAAYPYAWPMVGMAVMSLTGYSEAVPVLLNTLILGLFAILLVSLAREEGNTDRPSFGTVCVGLLAATALSPTFVHKLAFSAYADVVTSFLVAILVLTAERMTAPADGESGHPRLHWGIAFGLVGAAVLAVKPGNAGLFACALGGGVLLILRRRGWRGLMGIELLPAILLPLSVSLMWRWHVEHFLPGQEMGIIPFAKWDLALIPRILKGMADVASQKGGHFGLGLVITLLGMVGFARCRDRLDRLAALAGMLFLGYNLFLLTTYVVVFGGQDAVKVMSFWRYNTHTGLAVMLPTAVLAGRILRRIRMPRVKGALSALAIVLALVGPVAGLPLIRFDLDAMKQHYREVLRQLPAQIPPGTAVAIVDPQGTGLAGRFASYEWEGRLEIGAILSAFVRTSPSEWLRTAEPDWAIVLSGQEMLHLSPANASLLMHRAGTEWTVIDIFPAPAKRPERYP